MRRVSVLASVLLAMLAMAAQPAGAHPLQTLASAHRPRQSIANVAVEWDAAAPVDGPLGPGGATVGSVRRGAAPARALAVPSHGLVAAAPLPATPWAALAALVGLSLLVAWRPRAVLTLTLVLVLGVLAFETGLHSTHHLERPDDAARCAVAGASSQLNADLIDVTLDVPRASLVPGRVAALDLPAVAARVVAPDAGRAPPSPSA